MDQPLEAVLLGKLRVQPEGEAAEAVEQLTYIPGSATGCPNNLLVLGGQMLEMPPALTILPLECLSGNGGQQVSNARVSMLLTCTASPLICLFACELHSTCSVVQLDKEPCLCAAFSCVISQTILSCQTSSHPSHTSYLSASIDAPGMFLSASHRGTSHTHSASSR